MTVILYCLQAVDVKKLQGTTMNVSTEGGSLKVKAIYAESSCVSSSSGRIELGHVHGEQSIKFYLFSIILIEEHLNISTVKIRD